MKDKPKVKILVGYHKPAKLIKNDIFIPIHLGRAIATRASKDGSINKEDYQWMLDNMIGDDTGDNISKLNRSYAELTGIYWAWKNYDKLGNPDYIGFMHYRRYFNQDDIVKHLDDNVDIIATEPYYFKISSKKQFILSHEEKSFKLFDGVLKQDDSYNAFAEFFNGRKQYLYNIFVMKKEIFMQYCEWLFTIVNKIDELIDYTNIIEYNYRLPAFCAERLTSFYIEKSRKNKKVIEIPHIFDDTDKDNCFPIANTKPDNIPIVLITDNNYINCTIVSITSMMEHSDKNNNYDVYVIEEDLDNTNKNKFKILEKQYDNLSVILVNISSLTANIDKNGFCTDEFRSPRMYYKIFMDKIFKNFEKIIYLDSDVIVLDDISKLYGIDVKNHTIAATKDIYIKALQHISKNVDTYIKNVLKLKSNGDYFQTGVLLININKFIQNKVSDKLYSKLENIKTPKMYYKCLLNTVLKEDDVLYIDSNWNFNCNLLELDKKEPLILNLNHQYMKIFKKAGNNPYILHFSGAIKPWQYPEEEYAYIWWKYARMTPFYEEIIYKNTKAGFQASQVTTDMRDKLSDILTIFDIKLKHRKRGK